MGTTFYPPSRTHARKHTDTHACKHTDTHANTRTHTPACKHIVSEATRRHTCVYTRGHTHARKHTPANTECLTSECVKTQAARRAWTYPRSNTTPPSLRRRSHSADALRLVDWCCLRRYVINIYLIEIIVVIYFLLLILLFFFCGWRASYTYLYVF